MNNKSKKLGIIGGMGSQATAYFFNRIVENTEASKDQEHIDIIMLNHSTLPDRTKAILSNDCSEFVSAIVEDAKKLEYLGVDNIAIPCNTSHFFYDDIQKEINVHVINMVKETISYIINHNPSVKKIGILATDGTVYTKTYENECKLHNIEPIFPSAEKQKIVMSIIYDEIKTGKKGSLDNFMEVVNELKEKDCETIILACTELSYFKQYYAIPDYCIDSMDILVLKSIELSGKKYKHSLITTEEGGTLKSYNLQRYCDELEKKSLLIENSISENNPDINYLSYSSKDIGQNTLFVCKGERFKEQYLQNAVEQGITAYIGEKKYSNIDIPYIIVNNIRQAMPVIASLYYNEPFNQLKLIGITGTKGKSTTAYYIKYILDEYLKANNKNESAILSSIDVYDGKIKEEAHLTTPEALDVYRHMRNAVDSHIDFLEMEVSSQGLKYNRVDGIKFDVGVYLNISEDHISPLEHPDFEDYYNSKLMLFKQSKIAVVNVDADFSEQTLEKAKAAEKTMTFSIEDSNADIYGYDIKKNDNDTLFKVKTARFDQEFKLTMPGLFNVENALAAIAVAYVFDIPEKYMYMGLEKAHASGRMEKYASKDNKIIAIVDYAHNKLSFEELFDSTIKEYPDREIITIFGCPGLKALIRRKDLGTIAGKYSKKVYIVAEDPGYEPVVDISKDIAQYVKAQNCEYTMIEDRGEAIKEAIFTTTAKNVILITGKGNETRQKYGDEYIPCMSDIEYVKKYLTEYDL